MTPLTDTYLSEIEARLNAATPGPWWTKGEGRMEGWGSSEKHPGYAGNITAACGQSIILSGSFIPVCGATPAECEANAGLIAHAPADIAALLAEVRRLRDRNSRLQQKLNALSNNTLTDADLQKILAAAESAPGGFSKDHEYGCVNVIGKATTGKDLHCCIRIKDLSFFSEAKATIRKLTKEVQRLRNKGAAE